LAGSAPLRTSVTARRRLLFVLSPLAVLLVLFGANSLANRFRIDADRFRSSAARLLDRADQLTVTARRQDQASLLASLGSGELNGVRYRFDDLIDEAAVHDGAVEAVAEPSESVSFDFNGKGLTLAPTDGSGSTAAGILSFTHSISAILESSGTLEIDPGMIGEIELRVQTGKTREITLFWTSDPDRLPWDGEAKMSSLAIWVVPGGEMRTYRVDVGLLMGSLMEQGEPIRKIFLQPNGPTGDVIAIDHFRLLSRRARFSGEPCGVGYETLNNEMRRVIHTRTGVELRFDVEIPEERPMLRFGMGIHDDDVTVVFEATVHAADGAHPFTRTISSPSGWSDVALELSAFAGQRVEISFNATSPGDNIAFWSNPVLTMQPRERLNVVVVLEDALRADRLSCCGGDPGATPVKDELAARGAIFLRASSQATYTRASCASLMTSLHPSATGVWDPSEMLDDRYLTLAEIMRHQGFSTASFIQNPHAGPYAGMHQGFSTLVDGRRLGRQPDAIYGGPALGDWLRRNHDRNVFLYLHLFDPHAPYDPPREGVAPLPTGGRPVERDERFDPEWIEQPTVESRRHLYDTEVRNNDRSFSRLLEMLSSMGLLGDTLIVFISDHGEHLAEHGLLWDHVPPGYTQVLHVPLILFWPGEVAEGVRVEHPVQLLDVMPTVLDAAGVDCADLLLGGDSLLPLARGADAESWRDRICVSEEVAYKRQRPGVFGSLFYREWHILNSEDLAMEPAHSGQTVRTRVFNLVGGREEQRGDVGFRVDPFFTPRVRTFLEEFRRRNLALREAIVGAGAEQDVRYDPATIDELKALGYIE